MKDVFARLASDFLSAANINYAQKARLLNRIRGLGRIVGLEGRIEIV